MTSDQELVATIGIILILLVLWTTYKPMLHTILFNKASTPPPSKSVLTQIGSFITPLHVIERSIP